MGGIVPVILREQSDRENLNLENGAYIEIATSAFGGLAMTKSYE